jgi:transcriptional regulator GlxA family with amidase domain
MEEVLASSASPAEIAAMVAHVEAHFGRAVAAGQADAVAVERLRAFAGRQAPVVTVPRSHEEVVDVEALLAVGAHLIGE